MSFRVALSGLNAATADLGATAHNIANVNTNGFKASRAEFAELFPVSTYGVASNATGSGVRLARVAQQFDQGALNFTRNSLDLAISGDGFFTVSNGETNVYTRAGAFGTDRDGNVVNAAGQRLQVYPPVDGATGFNTAQLRDLQLNTGDNPPRASTSVTAAFNLPASAEPPANASFDPLDANSFNFTTAVTVFDSLGASHNATLYFVKGANPGEWDAHTEIDGTLVSGPDPLVFSSTGSLTTPANGQLPIPPFSPTNGADPVELNLDLAQVTQFGDRFSVSTLQQDGFASGRLVGVEITADGVVQARFTNGQATPLGQLAIARFANPQGLQSLGDTTWGESAAAGAPLRGTAGSSGFGLIESGALEAANVDLTEQLVNMITAQRNFQANAQMISTNDQITQTIINLR